MVALRREGLVVEAVHDEVLVFNPGRSEATALNHEYSSCATGQTQSSR